VKMITKEMVAQAVAEAIPELAFVLPRDIEEALVRAAETETSPRASEVLRILCENARIAARDRVPICQDTGSIWVCLEVGPDVLVPGDVFADVNAAVAEGYIKHNLRKSIVRNALFDRTNTGDNTPAFTELRTVDTPGARLQVMLKGGGSDNASRVVMLTPGQGREGIVNAVLDCVREKAANACPPLIIGIGIGATFDKVASLAKHALMRPLDVPNPDADAAELERELLSRVNALGVGAGALGGATTALGVRVETAPCHIAALPLAINMGCSAMRRATIEL
jgi:fumarate hydratase subunit alpha